MARPRPDLRDLPRYISGDDVEFSDDYRFDGEHFDEPLSGRKETVIPGEDKVIVNLRSRKDGGFDRYRLTVRCLAHPIQITILSTVDDEEIEQILRLAEGQTQSIPFAADSVRVNALHTNDGSVTNATVHWRLDRSTAPAGTWMTDTSHSGTGAEDPITPPPFAHSFYVYLVDTQGPVTVRHYEDTQAGVNLRYQETISAGSAGPFQLNRLGPMTIEKTAGERFTLKWRCHG